MRWALFLSLLVMLFGCSRMEQSEKEKIRRVNEVSEKIYRLDHEIVFTIEEPLHQKREKYPWEAGVFANYLKITKEHFRCKGSALNLPRPTESGKDLVSDCSGMLKHGLPYRDGKEFIYSKLIEILNYVQEKLESKVVITTGYRCPEHNAYADGSKANQVSKHQLGGEVDFYVEGYESRPKEVVAQIMQLYHDKKEEEYLPFKVALKNTRHLKHPGWYNKEIIVRIYEKDEGRDFDNRHPYPYISIELRYDREKDELVQYNWQNAHRNYIRH